jgi:hypothetical protein
MARGTPHIVALDATPTHAERKAERDALERRLGRMRPVVDAALALCYSGYTVLPEQDMGRLPLRLLRGIHAAVQDYLAAEKVAEAEGAGEANDAETS